MVDPIPAVCSPSKYEALESWVTAGSPERTGSPGSPGSPWSATPSLLLLGVQGLEGSQGLGDFTYCITTPVCLSPEVILRVSRCNFVSLKMSIGAAEFPYRNEPS